MKRLFFYNCILIVLSSRAQDLHFSQFTEQHPLINPALTGAVTKLRVSMVHRKQWSSVTTPYVTKGGSVEIRSPGRLKRTGKFGRSKTRTPGLIALGLSYFDDMAGDGKLKTSLSSISLASFIPAGKKNFFSVGLQAGLVRKKFDHAGLIFPNQYTGNGYDPSLLPGEEVPGLSYQFTDVAAGFLWSYGNDIKTFIAHRELKARLGASVYHLTRPSQQYFERSADVLNMKYVVHGDVLSTIEGTHLAYAPSFIYQMQGNQKEIVAGIMLKAYNSNDTKFTGYIRRSTFGLGAYYRSGDALIFAFSMELEEQYAVGISYDVNISALKNVSRKRGGIELTFRYTPANPFLYQKK